MPMILLIQHHLVGHTALDLLAERSANRQLGCSMGTMTDVARFNDEDRISAMFVA